MKTKRKDMEIIEMLEDLAIIQGVDIGFIQNNYGPITIDLLFKHRELIDFNELSTSFDKDYVIEYLARAIGYKKTWTPTRAAIFTRFFELAIDSSQFDLNTFDDYQLTILINVINDGLPIDLFLETKTYDYMQMLELFYGYKSGLDISMYNNPDFSAAQMHEIYLGLLSDIPITYNNPSLSVYEMKKERESIEKNNEEVL